MPMSVIELSPGSSAIIDSLHLEERDARVLRAMGVAEGDKLELLRCAPFGGPVHVRVGAVAFALDRSVAAQVRVRKQEVR